MDNEILDLCQSPKSQVTASFSSKSLPRTQTLHCGGHLESCQDARQSQPIYQFNYRLEFPKKLGVNDSQDSPGLRSDDCGVKFLITIKYDIIINNALILYVSEEYSFCCLIITLITRKLNPFMY